MSSITRLALLGAVALFTPGLAASDTTTIPKGTSIDLILQDGLSTRTAKVGNTFRATVVPGLDIDDRQILPEGTVVVGKVELVKSTRKGSLTGVIGVKFTHIQLPGDKQQSLDGELTSWRQDDRKRLVELAPKLSTGRKIDTVFIGQSTAGRASTLVGDDLAKDFSDSGLGAPEVTIAAGTRITMEFTESLTVPAAALRTAANPKLRRIHIAHASVAAAQRALTGRNYYHGEIDGQLGSIYGPTRQAIIRFQLEHEQMATGDLDADTLRLLDVKLAERP